MAQLAYQKDNNIINVTFGKKVEHKKQHNYTSQTVEPIKSLEDIERAKAYFYDNKLRYDGLNLRNYALFVFAINTGRRTSDTLNIKIGQIYNSDGSFKKRVDIYENKTGKTIRIKLHQNAKQALNEYMETRENYTMDDYLFVSRNNGKLSRSQMWRIMNDMAEEIGLDINVGATTTRKTFAYQKLMAHQGDPYGLAKTTKSLNHSSEAMTRNYVGLDQDEMDEFFSTNGL